MRLKPMLADNFNPTLGLRAEAIAQPKKDGWRAVWQDGGLWTRNGEKLVNPPEILSALADSFLRVSLDGELCGSSFRDISRTAGTSVVPFHNQEARYFVFDVLEVEGRSLIALPLSERMHVLVGLFATVPLLSPIVLLEWERADDPMEQALRFKAGGDEGAVLKYLETPYLCGMRPRQVWQKLKP